MKLIVYIFFGFVVLGAALLLIARGQAPSSNPAVLFAFVALFAVPPFGAFWMMYMAIRYEKNPFPMVLLAFIPFTFVWFYFERVRRGKFLAKRDLA
jgi:hypothetical protein